MLHLIALLDRAPRRRAVLHGIDGPVRLVRITPRLYAAAEKRREPAPFDERSLRAHDAIVRRLCGAADAVLPARFDVRADSESDLRDALAGRAAELAAAFDRVRGREQMTLRVHPAAGTRAPARPARRSRSGPGRRFLERRREEILVPAIDPVREAVAEIVRAERVETPSTPAFVATVHHLVDRGTARRYARLVTARAGRNGVPPLEVRGPFPPYAFVSPTEGNR